MRTWLRRIRALYLRWHYEHTLANIIALRHSKQVSAEGLRIMQARAHEQLRELVRLEGTK